MIVLPTSEFPAFAQTLKFENLFATFCIVPRNFVRYTKMDNNHALATLRSYIIEDLNYRHVGDYLVKQGLISQKEDFEIFQLMGKSRTTKLLNMICTRYYMTYIQYKNSLLYYLIAKLNY